MPHLHPSSISHLGNEFNAEKKVFEKLRALDDSYHVFHSLTWTDRREGECDFVIFHELKGFICLEVKGGEVRYDGRKWTSRDRDRVVHHIDDPVKQARNAMYAVKNFHEKKHDAPMNCLYGWGVCFLDGNWGKAYETLDLKEYNVLDARSLDNPAAWVENLFSELERQYGKRVLSKSDAEKFIAIFNKDLEIPLALNSVILSQEQDLALADHMQDFLLDLFEDKGRVAFQGAAGTGKTWVAMKKARALADAGSKVLFLCFNRGLAENLVREHLGGCENITVSNFHSLADEILRNYLMSLPDFTTKGSALGRIVSLIYQQANPDTVNEESDRKDKKEKTPDQRAKGYLALLRNLPNGPEYKSILIEHKNDLGDEAAAFLDLLLPAGDDYNRDRIPLAVMEAFEKGGDMLAEYRYDAVCIDEAQDFSRSWVDTVRLMLRDENEPLCWVFYDDNQNIFVNEKSLPVIDLVAGENISDRLFHLRDNLRNTRDIHRFAVARSGRGKTARSLELPGIEPVEKTCKNATEAREYLASLLEELIAKHGISHHDIVILSNRSIENSVLGDEKKLGSYTAVSSEGKRKSSIRFRTVHGFKGLEADVVIFLVHRRVEDQKDEYLSDELLYVGYTRARHLLYVVEVVG